MIKDFLLFIVGMAVIIKSADLFTDGAEGIARAFKIPRVIIGLTIVSFATTSPEFTVSVFSSLLGYGGMAVGNAVGSCLCNIGLILALAAMIRPIDYEQRTVKQEVPFLIGAACVLYLLMSDGSLGFLDGIVLILLLIGFLWFVIIRQLRERRRDKPQTEEKFNLKKDSFRFLLGAVGVIISARYFIIPTSVNIARFLGVPEIVIGLSMVAVGTSLPELFTALIASYKKMGELAAGNIIGANILNILWVLGFSSMVNPLQIDAQTLKVTMPVMLIVTVSMFLFARTRLKLTRNEGLFLSLLYGGYIFYLFKFAY